MKLDSHSKKTVLITGIDSFTGIHLKQNLEQSGFSVYGTSRFKAETDSVFVCDITDKAQLLEVIKATRPGYVVHLAGVSFVGHPVIEDFYRVNVLGTQNLLDALVESEIDLQKVILASSSNVYGNLGVEVLDESMCPKPANHYGFSKLAMEYMATTYFSKLPILITRPFNYVGLGQPEHFVIPKIIRHFKHKAQKIELGNLDVEREFNSVDYACEVYMHLLQSPHQSGIVNLCSGKGVKLKTVLTLMAEIAGYEIEVEVNKEFVRPNELPKLVGSVERLTKMIGEIKDFKLSDTLRKMYFD